MAEHTGKTLAEVGEVAALARVIPLLPTSAAAVIGPGDDSAVVAIDGGRVVVSCDTMVEGPDFSWTWSTPRDVGVKAIASNATDITSMGATVIGFEIAVAAPPTTPLGVLEELAAGFAEGIRALTPEAGVIGGDLSASPVFTIAVTVLGELRGRTPVTRSGARPGDVLAVAGELGLSRRGLLELHEAQGDAAVIARLRASSAAVAHHLAPFPPVFQGVVAADAGASAMMDISDGLVLDASRMAKASGVTIELDPLDDDALYGGEDHGLLAAFPSGVSLPEGFRRVGDVVARREGVWVSGRGFDLTHERGGWDPFQDFSANSTDVSP